MTTKRPHEMRDPIHGFIKLSETEKRLIDTQVFQRLRRIRQLALAFLVYPGALHTRFDHSIGVMHIAGQICNRLQELEHTTICDTTVNRIRFAALLHDVGHGPFSHLSETLLKKFAPTQQTDMGQVREKIHEKITVDIIRNDTEINNILSPCECNFVVKMIEGKEKRRDWHRDIVSSELDADKMDYLLRDSYFAGVKYGEYDLEKLIESCYISDHPETQLALNSEGIYALEQFMLAR
jgi:HD superfamily phosphohydrolase